MKLRLLDFLCIFSFLLLIGSIVGYSVTEQEEVELPNGTKEKRVKYWALYIVAMICSSMIFAVSGYFTFTYYRQRNRVYKACAKLPQEEDCKKYWDSREDSDSDVDTIITNFRKTLQKQPRPTHGKLWDFSDE